MEVSNLNDKAFIINQLRKMREVKNFELFSFFIDHINDDFKYDKNYLNNYISKYINFLENCKNKIDIRDKIFSFMSANNEINNSNIDVCICINDFWTIKKESKSLKLSNWICDINKNYDKRSLISKNTLLRVKISKDEILNIDDVKRFNDNSKIFEYINDLIENNFK